MWSAHTHARTPRCLLAPYGRRGCSDAASNGHRLPPDGAQHPLSLQRHFCARQAGTFLHFSSRGGRRPGCRNLFSLFTPPPGDKSSSVSSSLISAKMSVGCVILACTLLVGASAVRPVLICVFSSPSPIPISRFAVPRQVLRRAASP